VFTSDNGPRRRGPGKALPVLGVATTSRTWKVRCASRSSFAGQERSPRRVSNEIVHQVDTFTTFARLAGVPLPTDRAIDGVDQSKFFLGGQANPTVNRSWPSSPNAWSSEVAQLEARVL